MKKDKAKDLVRMVLPSKAHKEARKAGRDINRGLRHHAKQAIKNLSPLDDWDDAPFFSSISSAESWAKSKSQERVHERRDADKLGGLYRYVDHQKRTHGGNEQTAAEAVANVIKPGKNTITRHAMGHAASRLDVPGWTNYYRPEETERDRQAREKANRKRRLDARGAMVLSKEGFRIKLAELFSIDHAGINRILKKHIVRSEICKIGIDACMSRTMVPIVVYYIKDPSSQTYIPGYGFYKGRRAKTKEEKALATEEGGTTRVEYIEDVKHDNRTCKHKTIVSGPKDLEKLRIYDDVHEKDTGSVVELVKLMRMKELVL